MMWLFRCESAPALKTRKHSPTILSPILAAASLAALRKRPELRRLLLRGYPKACRQLLVRARFSQELQSVDWKARHTAPAVRRVAWVIVVKVPRWAGQRARRWEVQFLAWRGPVGLRLGKLVASQTKLAARCALGECPHPNCKS
jgi:hypothetical protein